MASPVFTARKTVVVADDTAFVRDRFAAALCGAGLRAVPVSNGSELLAYARHGRTPIDLLVLDLRLPQARGSNIVRRLQTKENLRAPILVFSGTIAGAQEVRELSALSIAGYINEYTSTHFIVPSVAPHLFPDQFNRRLGPRVALGIPVAYRFGNTVASGLTLNVCRGGIAIRTTSPLESGTQVRMRFQLPGTGRDVEADARVSWTNRRVGMGLQFTRLCSRSRAILDEFVGSHFFTNRKA